nr:uncharacterized protein LOC113803809 [Penaeus vannamei]
MTLLPGDREESLREYPERNYKAMKDFELDPKLPEFVLRQQRKRRNRFVAPTARPARVLDYDGDDEWTPEKEQSSRYASKNGSVGSGEEAVIRGRQSGVLQLGPEGVRTTMMRHSV